MEDAAELAARVGRVLDALGVPYVVGGSYASSIHGAIRSTNDVDLIADLRPEHIPALADALHSEFYLDTEMIADAIRRTSSFNLIHYETSYKVDIFVQGQDSFRRTVIARGLPIKAFGVLLPVASPEDIVLAKLDWYRLGGEVSDRQWGDITDVLRVQAGALDMEYVRGTAGHMGISDLLQRALDQAQQP